MEKYTSSVLAFVSLLLCGILFSCSSSDDGVTEEVEEDQSISISFTIRMSGTSSRAVDEEGEGRENYIDIKNSDYRFLVFNVDDNTYVTTFEPSIVIPTDGSEYPEEWYVRGFLSEAQISDYESFKLVVLANWGNSYPDDDDLKVGETTINDVCSSNKGIYTYHPDTFTSDFLADNAVIPMYGVATFKNNSYIMGWETNLGTIDMLRAMAKVEVILETDDYYNLSFSSLQINRYNSKGYCAPKDAASSADYYSGVHLVGGDNDTYDGTDKTLDFQMTERSESNGTIYEKWVVYLPEYKNDETAVTYFSSIKARFDNQITSDTLHDIYFADYSDTSNPPTRSTIDIQRNYIYRFYVNCTSYNYSLELAVNNWDSVYENDFVYGDKQVTSPVSAWEDEVDIDATLQK